MKCAELTEAGARETVAPQTTNNQGVISLPAGLLGFEQVKNYTLLGSAEEAPFLWLQMADDPNLAFLVIEPVTTVENYRPQVSEDDVRSIGLEGPEDAILLNIVTLHRDGTATVNLKGPIVVNRRTLTGKQIIPLNVGDYSLQHRLSAVAA